MPPSLRSWPAPVLALLAAAPLFAQAPAADRPAPAAPARPATRQELDHAEALKHYGQGQLREKHSQLLEAIRCYEEAARLDPDAAAPLKALVPLYLGVDRAEDALACCRRALELDPDDYDTGYLYGRQLRALGRAKEAAAALARVAARPGLKGRPELRAQVGNDLGQLYEEAGDLDKAEAAFRDVAAVLDDPAPLVEQGAYKREEIDARAAENYERLGRLCLKAGRADRAVADFEAAQKKDPERDGQLSYNLAEVFVAQKKPREALERLEKYLETQPQGVEGYELKIKLQRELGRDNDVVPGLAKASGHDAQNVALKLLLAREYRKAGDAAAAERVYTGLADDAPSADVYRGLFELFKDDARGGAARALAALDAAVGAARDEEGQPGDESAAARARCMLQALRDDRESVKRLVAEAQRQTKAEVGSRSRKGPHPRTRVLVAALAVRTRHVEAAEDLYRSVLARPDGAPPGLEQEVYGGLLRVLRAEHKYEEVVKLAEEGLDKAGKTNRVIFHVDLAEAHAALDHPKEALAAADDAVREAGEAEKLECRLVRADVLTQLDRPQEAAAECLALLKEYNQAKDVHAVRLALSSAYSAAHEHAKSEEQLRLILKEDADDATANNDLGYQWAERGKDLAEAEKLIRKALDLDRRQRNAGTGLGLDADQDNAAYVDSLGWVLFRRGRLPDACRELERAVALPGGTDDPAVWDHLGDVYARLEMRGKAAEAYKKALGLYETGRRRKADDRRREIKDKLRLVEP
jgi:tetratricopeptide (TPR) repeat protein